MDEPKTVELSKCTAVVKEVRQIKLFSQNLRYLRVLFESRTSDFYAFNGNRPFRVPKSAVFLEAPCSWR